jgi:hypothetical protein
MISFRCWIATASCKTRSAWGRSSAIAAKRIAALNDEVATFLVAVFTEALEQCIIKTFMPVGDKSHPPNLARLLRERIERPSRRDAEHGDEFAPFHE